MKLLRPSPEIFGMTSLLKSTEAIMKKCRRYFLTLLFLSSIMSSVSFGQYNIKDTVSTYSHQFEKGEITLRELDSALNQFFITVPEEELYAHDYKVYQRSMAFWRNRIDYNVYGEEVSGLYTKVLIDYLTNPVCVNGDLASWKYAYDPNPLNNMEDSSHVGACVEFGNHTAGIVFSVYMNPIDSNIILAGSNTSGLWRTENGGENWECVTDQFRIPALGISDIIDISKPSQTPGSVLIALTGKSRFHDSYGVGVLKSTDGGKNWTRHDIPLNSGGVMPILKEATKPYSESNMVYAISSDNIFYSDDQGSTWYELSSIPTTSSSFYGLSSTTGVVDKIYISTTGGNAKIWSTPTTSISWTEITSLLTDAASNCLAVNLEELFDFESGFGLLDTNSYYRPSLDTSYYIRDTIISGDTHLLVPSLTFDGTAPTDKGGLYLIYDFGSLWKEGEITVSCNVGLPEGGRLEFYIADVGNFIDKDTSIVEAEAFFLGDIGYEGTDAITSRTKTFTISESGYMDRLVVRFAYYPPYPYGSSTPILFDDLHVSINKEGQSVVPHAIGLSIGNGDDIYAIVEAKDSIIERHKVIIVNSTDNGHTWGCIGASQGNTHPYNGEVLASKNNFLAGYGMEEGFYYGGYKLLQFNSDVSDVFEQCTQHDDVRDIRIVKNVAGINHLLVGDDGGVSYSADGGDTWTSLNGTGLPISQFYDISINPHDNISMLGGLQDNGTVHGDHMGWTLFSGGDGNSTGFSPNPSRSNEYFFELNWVIKVANDSGIFYEVSHSSYKFNAYLNRPTKYAPISGNKIYEGVEGNEKKTYKNAVMVIHDLNPDGGYGPMTYIDFGSPSKMIGEIEISEQNESVLYVAEGTPRSGLEDKKLFISTDYGFTFTDLGIASTAYILDEDGVSTSKKLADVFDWKVADAIITNPTNPGELWIGMSGVQRSNTGSVIGGLFRVLHSADSGKTWQDYSVGLPPFPVNDLIYQKETNNRLFAATDVGIFYREAGMDEWQCFQEGMPATFSSDLEINYCQQTLYAATFGRGIWKTPIDLPDSEPVIVNTNLTWGGVQQFEHDIIIESGSTLTLNGTIEMAGGKKIIVEQGARLKVDGGTITNSCEAFWAGVEVHGNAVSHQAAAYQGVVTLLNGATIENAEVAIALWEPGNWASTGGIVYSTASSFVNNKKDVEFLNYQNINGVTLEPIGNLSYFRNTTFTWNDDFLAEFPLGHVTLYKVDGVRFTGCAFKDERTDPTSRYYEDYAKNNSGIYSIDAQYFVLPACNDMSGCTGGLSDDPDWQPTTFENLDFGIYASNIGTERNVVVDRSIFENNLYGLQTVNINQPVITRNRFDFNNDTTNNFTAYTQCGLHLVRSAGINVQENSFINDDANNRLQGIVCSDLGESDEDIYKNTFVDLSYGVMTQGKNRYIDPDGLTSGQVGLEFICDNNHQNSIDHLVLGTLWGGSPSSLYGVKAFNGTSDEVSGTVFSLDDPFPTGIHYNNQSSNELSYFYFYSEDDSTQKPIDILGTIYPISRAVEYGCPSKLATNEIQSHTNGFLSTTMSDFNTYSADLDTVLTNYTALVNGGDTDALLTTIAGLTVNNRDTVHALLLSLSPYLTEEVVRATVNHPITKYPHAWAYELVEENIEVAYKPGFMEFLATKTYPLPNSMITDLQTLVDNNASTSMLNKQLKIAELQSKKANAANILLQSLKNDTTGVDVDSIRYWIQAKGDVLAQTRVIDTWLQAGNYSAAQGALTALNADIQNYPAHLQDELTDYVSFKDKLIDLLEAGTPLDSLSETDHNFMTDLAESGEGLARYQAQELLCFFYDECAEYPIDAISQQSLAPMQQGGQVLEAPEARSFKIYPNPAQSWIAIELPKVDAPLLITLVDLSGRLVYQKQLGGINGTDRLSAIEVWDTHLIGDGVYLITITDQNNTESFGTQRVVIQH